VNLLMCLIEYYSDPPTFQRDTELRVWVGFAGNQDHLREDAPQMASVWL
jgi:hypothetical protein